MGLYLKNSNGVKILEMPLEKRPREKMRIKGVGSLNNRELLAVILGKGTQNSPVLKIADEILKIINKNGIVNINEKLLQIGGIGEAKMYTILAAIEFTKRILNPEKNVISKPEDAFHWVKEYSYKNQEHFIVLSLNGANEILMKRIITIGLLNSSQVHPREVFSDPITDRAASIILAHNHPSGIIEPSIEDIHITEKLKMAGEILGIPVLDHIIFSKKGFRSMLETGML